MVFVKGEQEQTHHCHVEVTLKENEFGTLDSLSLSQGSHDNVTTNTPT